MLSRTISIANADPEIFAQASAIIDWDSSGVAASSATGRLNFVIRPTTTRVDSWFVDRREDNLTDCERSVRVGERGSFRPNVYGHSDIWSADVQRITLEPKGEVEIINDLQRVDPCLERAILVTEHSGSSTHDIEEGANLCASLQLQPALLEFEPGD